MTSVTNNWETDGIPQKNQQNDLVLCFISGNSQYEVLRSVKHFGYIIKETYTENSSDSSNQRTDFISSSDSTAANRSDNFLISS